MEKKITVSIIRHDEMDAFGAYGAKSIHSPEGGEIELPPLGSKLGEVK